MKRAILDLDDTLGDMRSAICSEFNKKYNKSFHWKVWQSFGAESIYGISREEFFETLIQRHVIERMKPHPESAEFVNKLSRNGYTVSILTARKWHPDADNITREWLDKNNIFVDEVVICDTLDSKQDIVSSNYELVDFTVDDSILHCNGYAGCKNVSKVFIYDMPWNRCDCEDFGAIRIKNLNEIFRELRDAKEK